MSRFKLGEFHINSAMIAQHDRFLSSIVQSASDAIIGLDSRNIVLSWNYGAQLLFGYTEAEMVGMPLEHLIPPDRRQEQASALSHILAGETIATFHTICTDASGRAMSVLVTMSPVTYEDGTIYAASAIIRPASSALHRPDTVELPCSWTRRHAEDAGAKVDRRNILVVDDEALTGLGLTAMLENVGHDVIGPAGNIQSAMTLIETQGCVLAILAPSLQSGETCEPLAQRLQQEGIPFFLTSGPAMSGKGTATQGAIFSDAPRFPKPVRLGPLLAAVQHVLDRAYPQN